MSRSAENLQPAVIGLKDRSFHSRPLLILVMILFSSPLPADELTNLLQEMSAVKSRNVQFAEEKRFEMLDEVLYSEGRLEFTAPHRLVRIVDTPAPARYIIDGNTFTLEKKNKRVVRDISQLPSVQAFVASFRSVLAGDRGNLEKFYRVTFAKVSTKATYDWHIRLLPRDKKLRQFVSKIDITGSGSQIKTYTVEDSNGDATYLQLIEAVQNRDEVNETEQE